MPAAQKLVVLGASGVGKTRLCQRLRRADTSVVKAEVHTTVGAKFHRVVDRNDGVNYMMWDISGHPRYNGLIPLYLPGASRILLVYNLRNASTFSTLLELCEQQLLPQKQLLSNVQIILVGTHAKARGTPDPPTITTRQNMVSILSSVSENKINEVHVDCVEDGRCALLKIFAECEMATPSARPFRSDGSDGIFGRLQAWLVQKWCQ